MQPFCLSMRMVLAVTGADRLVFLQGLITQDVEKIKIGGVGWGAFLTPQGRINALFFLFKTEDTLFIDCCALEGEVIFTQLKRFKLRSKVEITRTSYHVWVGDEATSPPEDALIWQHDPRTPKMGWRALSASSDINDKNHVYLEKRLSLALPEQEDIISGETLVLEINMDHLHGVSWEKGCYMGQEVTARTHYRGLIKKRLFTISYPQGVFSSDERRIFNKEGREVAVLKSFFKESGLILLHRSAWNEEKLFYKGQEVLPHKPDYLKDASL